MIGLYKLRASECELIDAHKNEGSTINGTHK